MDTLKSMKVFCAVVKYSSFTLAAEHLNISIAMASKHIRNLEHYTQAKLLNRNNRKLSLTEVGDKYHHECLYAIETLDKAKQEANQGSIVPKGALKITCPVWFAGSFFTDLIAEFNELYPEINLSIYLGNKHNDLIAGGYDIALRVTAKPEENLIVTPLADVVFYYVASPIYLKKKGKPKGIQELQNHVGISPNYLKNKIDLPYTHNTNNTIMNYELARSGLGIACLPDIYIERAIAKGELVKLFKCDAVPTLYVAYMNREYLSIKIRVFIEFLKKKIKGQTELGGKINIR